MYKFSSNRMPSMTIGDGNERSHLWRIWSAISRNMKARDENSKTLIEPAGRDAFLMEQDFGDAFIVNFNSNNIFPDGTSTLWRSWTLSGCWPRTSPFPASPIFWSRRCSCEYCLFIETRSWRVECLVRVISNEKNGGVVAIGVGNV